VEFVAAGGAGPQRPRVPEVLSDPSLTGMSRPQLAEMIERLSHHQAARTERHRYRCRGAERLPTARGGVFRQKITDAERVLATVLYQRGLCTRETLAELFEVSRRTVGKHPARGRPAPSTRRLHPGAGRIAVLHRSCPSRLRDTTARHNRNSATTVLILLLQ